MGKQIKPNETMNEKIIKNPITTAIKESVNESIKRINFAVPFISSFATSIFNESKIKSINEKKIVTRFDDSFINSFDLPTLKTLLDFGFEIRYNNNIHLKLYITDKDAYVTSSNLTKGGFEDNDELTVKVDSGNTGNCILIFDEIWDNCKENIITQELLNANLGKYEILKKREWFAKKGNKNIVTNQIKIGEIDIQEIITEIFNWKQDFSKILSLEFEANKLREQTKEELKQGFSHDIFYVHKGHPKRRNTLFYDFEYGYENKLAGTGLRELQFKTVFEHPDFEKVINYIYPEMIGMKPWNFQDKTVLLEFCNGIFNFNIPQYSEAIPIRLASYFYPDLFLPIFKLEHLKKTSVAFGLETNAKTKGDKLYAYNSFLADKMKTLPLDNYIKMEFSYQILYTVELYNRLNEKEDFDKIVDSYKESWKRNTIKEGMKILTKINKIK